MNLRKSIIGTLAILLLSVTGLASILTSAAVFTNCSPDNSICINVPAIVKGDVTNSGYFTGPIKVESVFKTSNMLENVIGEFSTDNWLNSSAALISNDSFLNIPIRRTKNNYYYSYPENDIETAAFSDGEFVTIWTEDGTTIHARRYSENGSVIGNYSLVKPLTNNYTYVDTPRVSVLPNDDWVVCWNEDVYASGSVWQDYRRFSCNFYSKDGRFLYNDSWKGYYVPSVRKIAPYFQTFDLAATENGVFVAGREYETTGKYAAVVYFVDYQNKVTNKVYQQLSEYIFNPRITSLPGGGALLTNVTNASAPSLYVVEFSANGNSFRNGPLVATDYVWGADISSDETGNYVVAWTTSTRMAKLGPGVSYTDAAITARRFRADGVGLGAARNVVPPLSAMIMPINFDGPMLTHMSDGIYVVSDWVHTIPELRVNIIDANSQGELVTESFIKQSTYYSTKAMATNAGIVINSSEGVEYVSYFKSVSTWLLEPGVDFVAEPGDVIPFEFKVITPSGVSLTSGVRNYTYADPNDGSTIQIDYPAGLTNAAEVLVSIPDTIPNTNPPEPVCITCGSFEVFQRKVAVQSGVCSMPADDNLGWSTSAVKSYLTLPAVNDPIAVDDNYCYQFKVATTNMNGTGTSFEYINPNIVQVDRTAPTITYVTENAVWDSANLDLTFQDDNSGINQSTARYQINNGTFVPFSGTVTLIPGTNFVKVEVEDNAGNVGTYSHTFFFDNTPPDIVIHTIEDGGTYGADVSLDFSLTQPLSNLTILVDGVPRSDLVGLADGVHTIVISGYDAQGNLVQKTVTFTKDSTLFTVTVLSPYSGTYDINDITIDYTASKPVSSATYTLDGVNGGAVTNGMILPNLADGNHLLSLVFTPATGVPVTKDIPFTVKDGIPALNVFAPVEGAIYPANKFVAEFSVDSSSSVSYQIVGQGGALPDPVPITSGTEISVPSDGSYTLILTATHNNSGNQLSQMVHITTDAVQPAITLASPHTGVYTFDAMPINYSSNKPLNGIEYFLDGNPVTELVGLTTGPHSFRIQAKDSANRLTQQVVQFNVATLEIQSPQNGESVISNTMPPKLPFRYGTSGGFTSFNVAVDSGPRQLLVDPPGATIPLPMSPGDHEVTLRGQVYGLTAAKRADFTIGAMNVSVGKGSLNYTYANCDAVTSICDVTASVRVTNSGDYAVNQPITVRFDHIATGGYQTQWQTLSGLPIGQSAEVFFTPFQATLGDTFAAFIDPNSEIVGEWTADNAYSLTFQTGQITAVTQELSEENVYLEGVSIFNRMVVSTAGAIASVEVRANDITFVDRDGANGFNLIADLGLLTDTFECVQVIAKSSADVALDSSSVCFDVRPLIPEVTTKFEFPWASYSQNGVVDLGALSIPDVAATLASLRSLVLTRSYGVLPLLGEGGVVDYKLLADPAGIHGRAYTKATELGSSVLDRDVPNGHGIFLSTINLKSGTCASSDATPIMMQPHYQDVTYLYNDEIYASEILNQISQGVSGADIEGLEFIELYAGGGLIAYSTDYIYSDSSTIATVMGQILPNASAYILTWGWEDQRAEVTEELGIEYGFDGAGCFIADSPQGVQLAYDGEYRVHIDSQTMLKLSGQNINILGYAGFSYGALYSGSFFSGYGVILTGNVSVYPQSINLLADLGFNVKVAIVDGQFYVAPITTNYGVGIHHNGKLAKADLVIYPTFMYGFGFGVDWKADIHLNGDGMYDMVAGNQTGTSDFVSHEFRYAEFDGRLVQFWRWKVCFLGECTTSFWLHLDTTDFDDNPNGYETTGTKYKPEDVAAALEGVSQVDLGGINDLTALGLYSLIVGDTQLAQEYFSCGVLQDLEVGNMSYTPLYSTRSGSCAPVTEPDFEPGAGSLYYTDAACTSEVDYKPTSFLKYCQNNLLPQNYSNYVGNAAAWLDEESGNPAYPNIGRSSKWTLSHGAAIDALALSPAGNHRPYMKQVEYRTVGSCSLEMRVYKKNITDTNLKPLLLVHGGAWKYRGYGALGADALASQFTENGYIVFQPYYRLMGDADGPADCQLPVPAPIGDGTPAPGEAIAQDIDAALDWVEMHGPTLGSAGGQVALVGQSAGAHLSGWLASRRSAEISKALLIYPPTDAPNYIGEMANQKYGNPPVHDGLLVLSEFLNLDIAGFVQAAPYTLNPAILPPFTQANSFPDAARIDANFPPTFMLHGNADTLVPVNMSTRMCDALAGAPYGTNTTAGGRYTCGSRRGVTNVMHIIDGANHMLDMKCFVDGSAIGSEIAANFQDIDLGMLCPSGSQATSDNIVKPALAEAVSWMAAP